MGLEERIRIVVDVVTDKASTGMASFRTSVGEADGVVGKFKAGAGAAFDTVKQNAGALAMAGGTALLAFGKASVSAFEDTALAAGKFSAASGVSVEEASKWRAVADDFDINADAIQGSIIKMSTALGKSEDSFKQYGIEVVRAKDGTVDANATFINTATTIGAIKDPIERATAAKKLMGKSFTEVSRLMEMDAKDLKAALDSTSDAQIIDQSELDKARDYQAALDNLGVIVEDLKLQFGEAIIPVLTDFANSVKTVNDAANALFGDGGLGKLYDWSQKIFNPLTKVRDVAHELNNAFGDDLEGKISDTAFATRDAGAAADEASPSIQTLSRDARDDADAMAEADKATRGLDDAVRNLVGTLDAEDAFANFQEKLYAYKALGADPSAQATRDYTRDLAGMITKLEGVPDETKARLITELSQGDLAAVEGYLWKWGQGVTVPVRFAGQGSVGFEKKAKGGDVNAGQPYVVGDNPDGSLNSTSEVFVPGASGTIVPANKVREALGQPGAAGGSSSTFVDNSVTNISLPAGFSDKSVLAGQRRYRRLQGPT